MRRCESHLLEEEGEEKERQAKEYGAKDGEDGRDRTQECRHQIGSDGECRTSKNVGRPRLGIDTEYKLRAQIASAAGKTHTTSVTVYLEMKDTERSSTPWQQIVLA